MTNCIGARLLAGLVFVSSAAVWADEEWNPSTLPEETLDKARAGAAAYRQCLDEQLRANLASSADSRAITDTILKTCEERLNPIRLAFEAQKVPPQITERYLRQQRTQGARNVLREVMGAQAVRQANPP